jgi:hypothetical protein
VWDHVLPQNEGVGCFLELGTTDVLMCTVLITEGGFCPLGVLSHDVHIHRLDNIAKLESTERQEAHVWRCEVATRYICALCSSYVVCL